MDQMPQNYEALLPFAVSESQKKAIQALIEHGSARKAAKALGIDKRNVERALKRIRVLAAQKDPAQHAKQAPDAYHLKGVSTLVDGEGRVVQQWIKTAKDATAPADVLELFKAAVEDGPPRARTLVPPAKNHDADLLSVYPMGDPHIGMLAWGVETGADFDLKIAEHNLVSATRQLVALSPPSKRALVVDVGDFFHADNMTGTTARSGNKLDTDSRWGKVLQVGLRAKVACIDAALEKHETVEVIITPGNHDDHSAVMLSLCLQQYYRENVRVVIAPMPTAYQYVEFGLNLFGITHGHLVKGSELPSVMAYDKPDAWGRTKHRFWLCGHIHHYDGKEYRGCLVEHFNTLAGRDAWTHAAGFRSDRNMLCHVHHMRRGRILTHKVGVEDIEPGTN